MNTQLYILLKKMEYTNKINDKKKLKSQTKKNELIFRQLNIIM